MAQELFKFVLVESGKKTYTDLAKKDPNTLYAITETQELYFDGNLVADKNVVVSETMPADAGRSGVIYVVTGADAKGIYYYDGTEAAYKPVFSFGDITTALNGKVDKREGYSLVSDAEIERLSKVDNYTHPSIAEAVEVGTAYNKVTFDELGHVATASAETTLAGLGIGDAYTKEEVDAAISKVIQNLDWKETVSTFDDIATTYPTPEEGWTVSVADTNQVYRYDVETTSWVNIFQTETNIVEASVDGNGGHAGLMTAAMAEKLNSIQAGGEVNQNAYSTIIAGADTLSAATKTDSIKLVGGTNITISGTTSEDGVKTVTIAGPETYIHPTLAEGVTEDTAYNKVTFDALGHVKTATAETTLKGLGVKGDADDIVTLAGYAKASAKAAISADDSLNVALGKLEYRVDTQAEELSGVLDNKVDKTQIVTELSDASTTEQIASAKTVYDAIKVVRL